jgi:hypothetical protein
MFSLSEGPNELLRGIRRSILQSNKDSQKQKDAASRVFAYLNRWEYHPMRYPFCLHGLQAGKLQHCGCVEANRGVFRYPLVFTDQLKQPAAIVGQSYSNDAAGVRRIAKQYGLEVHQPAARYASIFYPGACDFHVFSRPGTLVKWLPEQTQQHGPFALGDWETPTFRDFVHQYDAQRDPEDACSIFISDLLRLYGHGRRWRPSDEFVSNAHLNTFIYNLPISNFGYDVAAAVWLRFEHWRTEQVATMVRLGEETMEVRS